MKDAGEVIEARVNPAQLPSSFRTRRAFATSRDRNLHETERIAAEVTRVHIAYMDSSFDILLSLTSSRLQEFYHQKAVTSL